MKSVALHRKQRRESQAGPPVTKKGHPPQKATKTSPSKWSKWELITIAGSIFLLLYIMLCYENFHFHVAHMYAHLGYPNAQHIVGQRYLKGVGVEKNEEKAMQWFREAAEKGHPHSSFNLAVGKLKNMTTGLEERLMLLGLGNIIALLMLIGMIYHMVKEETKSPATSPFKLSFCNKNRY